MICGLSARLSSPHLCKKKFRETCSDSLSCHDIRQLVVVRGKSLTVLANDLSIIRRIENLLTQGHDLKDVKSRAFESIKASFLETE